MNTAVVEKIANAVLYEGYVLYPYRPSALKNRQRFNFGVLYPRSYCDLQPGADADEMRTECLISGNASSLIEIKIRFLQMATRAHWQEGQEREVTFAAGIHFPPLRLHHRHLFSFPSASDDEGRACSHLDGEAELVATSMSEDLFKLSLTIRNCTLFEDAPLRSRDEALLRSMVSVHTILQVTGGEFVSLLDPPEEFRMAAKECCNVGTYPVLAGEPGQKDLMLSAPIIFYDYPQIAPESEGDLCDGLEIDEILALRILTMTDAERLEVRNCDDRARRILERTELMQPEHFQKLHGALRGLRVSPGERS